MREFAAESLQISQRPVFDAIHDCNLSDRRIALRGIDALFLLRWF
jgi:hypothetical protein